MSTTRSAARAFAGEVTFRPAAVDKTEVTVQMDWEPEGLKEKIGGALGFDDRQIASDLERFEEVLDERGGRETGAWRGEQHERLPGGRPASRRPPRGRGSVPF